MTNLIDGILSDPWAFEGIGRTQFKHAMTPKLYGSSQPAYKLWQNKGHKYTMDQLHAFEKELSTGKLAVADKFKEFIIKCCKPSAKMTVKIWDEEFEIECNRWRNVGDVTKSYDIYDTDTDTIRTIHHTHTHKEPDLEQFRRYFVTLLIHNLDSQTGDHVCETVYNQSQWIIDIHDAFIVNPEDADMTRKTYADKITDIYNNRQRILQDYFTSIGITAADNHEWEKVKTVVTPMTEFTCSHMALK